MEEDKKEMKFLAFHIERELKETLVNEAKKDGRSLSCFMRTHLKKTFGKK